MTAWEINLMNGDDEESVFDRLWAQLIGDKFGFLVPLWIARRPESLTILDYRPTMFMFATTTGFILFAVLFGFYFYRFGTAETIGLWATGIPALVWFVLTFRGTIREAYYFDKTKDSYALVRQFIYRRDVIEGSLSQFTGAYVKTETNYNSDSNGTSKSYFVVLQQEGMFLTGVTEQTLREETPIFNTYDREASIANAISGLLASKG